MNDNDCSWTLVTGPATEPITLAEAKQQCKITHTNEDALVANYIVAARQAAEDHMARGLITQTWKLMLQDWAEIVWLPMAAPLQSVTTVKYYDTDGAQQTLGSTVYTVDVVSRPGRLTRAPNQSWPSLQADRHVGRIEITYVVGFISAVAVPERIKQGIRLHVGYLDCDREGLEEYAQHARAAAEACWTDRVYWMPPVCVG